MPAHSSPVVLTVVAKVLAFGTLAVCLGVPLAGAADKEFRFAAKGAGRKTCAEFLTAKESGARDYYLFGGWLEGYMTAFNRFQSQTFDMTPWQTTELLLSMVEYQCHKHPKIRLQPMTSGLIMSLRPLRLKTESPIVKLRVMEREFYYYVEVIKQVKARLASLGHYQGDTTSDSYGENEIRAMTKFQRASGLDPTGIPDQHTLVRLFIRVKLPG